VAIFAPQNQYSHDAYFTALSLSLLHFSYYGDMYAPRHERTEKGRKPLESAVQRTHQHAVQEEGR